MLIMWFSFQKWIYNFVAVLLFIHDVKLSYIIFSQFLQFYFPNYKLIVRRDANIDSVLWVTVYLFVCSIYGHYFILLVPLFSIGIFLCSPIYRCSFVVIIYINPLELKWSPQLLTSDSRYVYYSLSNIQVTHFRL
jgi:hypothetical protein